MALLTFTRKVGPALIFELHGSLDAVTAETLGPQVSKAIDEGQRVLIFDLGKLTYVSSAGLTIFLIAYRRLQNIGHVRFAALQSAVRQVFNVTAFTPRVEIYDTVEDAVVGPRPSP
jgi:anti-anti-sigma factor